MNEGTTAWLRHAAAHIMRAGRRLLLVLSVPGCCCSAGFLIRDGKNLAGIAWTRLHLCRQPWQRLPLHDLSSPPLLVPVHMS